MASNVEARAVISAAISAFGNAGNRDILPPYGNQDRAIRGSTGMTKRQVRYGNNRDQDNALRGTVCTEVVVSVCKSTNRFPSNSSPVEFYIVCNKKICIISLKQSCKIIC